jgi:uncharacterized protein involved in exopolysaccharide biosynthesis
MSISNASSQAPPPRRSPTSSPLVETPAPSDVFDLRVHLVNLWRGRVTLAVLAALLGLAGGAVSFLGKRQYEATATLSVSPSMVGEQPTATLDALKFVPMVANQNVASQTVIELKLNEAPYNLSAQALLEQVVTVRPSANLMRVVARLDDPDLAARVANGFSEVAIARALDANRTELGTVEGELKTMLDQATDRVEAAEAAYNDYRRTAQIELVRNEVETLLRQRAELFEVNVTLEAERARLATAEKERSSRSPTTTLRQSVVEDPATTEVARAAGGSARDLLGLEMNRQERNLVFEEIDGQIAQTRAKVASLERQAARLTQATRLKNGELEPLSQLYQREATLDRLDVQRNLARSSYESVASKYQGAKLAAMVQTPRLQVVDAATVPSVPVPRYIARNAMLGVVLGLLAGCIIVFGREALGNAVRSATLSARQ